MNKIRRIKMHFANKLRIILPVLWIQFFSGQVLGTSMEMSKPGKITNLATGVSEPFQGGQRVELKGSDTWMIYQNGSIPVLVFPKNNVAEIVFQPPSIESLVSDRKQFVIDSEIGQILEEYTYIQSLIRDKKYQLAEERLRKLRSTFPKVQFLSFIEASLKVLGQDKQGAATLLREALKYHPDYQDGKTLLENLEAR